MSDIKERFKEFDWFKDQYNHKYKLYDHFRPTSSYILRTWKKWWACSKKIEASLGSFLDKYNEPTGAWW